VGKHGIARITGGLLGTAAVVLLADGSPYRIARRG
jgi:hypothetical protein